MFVRQVRIENLRSIKSACEFALTQVNVLIGANNSGKTSILRAIFAMQEGGHRGTDVRIGANHAKVRLRLSRISGITNWANLGTIGEGVLHLNLPRTGGPTAALSSVEGSSLGSVALFPPREPDHLIVPYLSKRKSVHYDENVKEENALAVSPDFSFLAAKLSRLGNPAFPGHDAYATACKALLGFVVTAIPSANGQRPGVYLPDRRTLSIDQMGEGVPNIVGLLADLALSKQKIFLMEEPENDLHPGALKSLLELIALAAEHNQFIVSTHSNIVLRHLGSLHNSTVLSVTAPPDNDPRETVVQEISKSPQARIQVLRELGYSFSDFDLWEGWLILEEASAERIIRDYLVPMFAPRLSRIRTLSTGGNSQVEPTFEDFNRLVRFTHLEDAYRNKAWVLIDGDEEGNSIVRRLREKYKNWEPSRFSVLKESQFENYYPAHFRQNVDAALVTKDKQARRQAKLELLLEVQAWLDSDTERARSALAESASEVIEILRGIQSVLEL